MHPRAPCVLSSSKVGGSTLVPVRPCAALGTPSKQQNKGSQWKVRFHVWFAFISTFRCKLERTRTSPSEALPPVYHDSPRGARQPVPLTDRRAFRLINTLIRLRTPQLLIMLRTPKGSRSCRSAMLPEFLRAEATGDHSPSPSSPIKIERYGPSECHSVITR